MSLLRRTAPPRRTSARLTACAAAAAVLVTGTSGTAAANPVLQNHPDSEAVQLEQLDRGLVAASTQDGVFLSWRLLAGEVTGHGDSGLVGTDFRVYRDGAALADVTDSTNYPDATGTASSTYRVVPLVDGEEVDDGTTVTPWSQNYLDLPLNRPADGVTPAGEAYTYRANDVSVGDVDGDGQYEYVVKWDPSNSKDVSQVGYTGNVYVDTYELDGTLLHRLDLGVNIRAGAHYTQFLVYDFDGDGRSEIMLKTAPGTRTLGYTDGAVTSEEYITLLPEDLGVGWSNQDDYRLSAEGYYDHLVAMFQGWDEHPEVVDGSWPATIEEALGLEPTYDYPLSQADAQTLADYFIDVYAPARSERNDLRAFEGFILDGPEYLTVFDGSTGEELQTVAYQPGRGDDGLLWGDYAMSRIEPGNRVDRFLSGVAYLDGTHPSAVFARGYYTRSTIAAYDWDGEELTQRWYVDSGHVPMTNPFNDSPHGRDGTDPEFATITTQGFHSLSAADVDGDGRHEIVYGAATIDDDGSLLYSSMDVLPPESADPGVLARLGHGDAMHVTDIDPDRPGLEIYTVHEGGVWAPYGYALRDAADGEVLYGAYTGRDTGRGMVGDILPAERGLETWSVDLRTADGELIATQTPGTNQSIRWAADMTTQIVNGSGETTPTVDDWQEGTLLTATGTLTNNSTKGNPSLVADVFGDWREELLLRTVDSSALRIYLSTEVTDRKLYTLMHDPQYRAEVARQQTTYNQPSYPGFYLASDIDWSQVPLPVIAEPEPEPEPEPGPQFVDVVPGQVFYAEIRWLADSGLSDGTQVGDQVFFYPASPMSRQAMAAFLYRYAEEDWVPEEGTQSFPDVGPGHRFYTEIEWLHEVRLAGGYSDGTFGPTRPVSRQAMAAFLHRLAEEPAVTGSASFSDVPAGAEHAEAIAWLEQAGIAEGYADGTFGMTLPVTRQATAAFLHRFDQFLYRADTVAVD